MTAMINAAPQFNKEISNTGSLIKNCDIAMKIIHALPPALYSLQTILLESMPLPKGTDWDLQALGQHIMTAQICAQPAGLNLGTKLNNLTEPKALETQCDPHRGRSINLTWMS